MVSWKNILMHKYIGNIIAFSKREPTEVFVQRGRELVSLAIQARTGGTCLKSVSLFRVMNHTIHIVS